MRRMHAGIALLVLAALGCPSPEKPKADKPSWIAEPQEAQQSSKFISAVGQGTTGPDEATRLQEAEHAARLQLAASVGGYVTEATRDFMVRHPNLVDSASAASEQFVQTVSAEVAGAILRQSLRHDTWRDAQTNGAFVLYRVPISMVNDKIVEKVRFTLGTVSPFTPNQEDAAVASLTLFLNDRLKERVAATARRGKEHTAELLGATPPEWLAVGRHPRYPEHEFMTAIGLGDRRDAAEDSARTELSTQIAVHLVDRFRSITSSRTENGFTHNVQSVRQDTFKFTENDLIATRIVDLWYDPVTDTYYALGVLDRETAGAVYHKRIADAVKSARGLFESATNYHKADHYKTALEQYLQAIVDSQEAVRRQVTAMVVQPARAAEFVAMTEGLSLTEIKAGLSRLVGELSLRKITGDRQWTAPGVPLKTPLVVGVSAGREATPLANVPLRFRFVGGRGSLQEELTTGADGTASCAVTQVEPDIDPAGSVRCSLDLARLAPDADISGIALPSATFNYVLRARANTLFALYVEEKGLNDMPAADDIVRSAVEEALTTAGYSLVERSKLLDASSPGAVSGDAEAPDVLRAFSGLAESLKGQGFMVVITGQARCELIDTVQTSVGKLYFVHAPVTLRVIDGSLPQEPVVLVANAVGKDAFTDNPTEAARRARVKAARLASQQLIAALNEKFGVTSPAAATDRSAEAH